MMADATDIVTKYEIPVEQTRSLQIWETQSRNLAKTADVHAQSWLKSWFWIQQCERHAYDRVDHVSGQSIYALQ